MVKRRLRVAGEGDAGPKGGPMGDLYIFISVRPDKAFKRDGVDVYSDLDISYLDAILGGTKSTKTLDEEALEIKIPPGTQPGTKLRLRAKGVPTLNKPQERGTHFVTVNVKIPTQLSADETDLVQKLKKLEP